MKFASLLAGLLLAGCWRGVPEPRVTAGPPVIVRMAVEDEYPIRYPERASDGRLPVPGRTFLTNVALLDPERCVTAGPLSPAIRKAVDTYAREHLLQAIDDFGLGTSDAVLPRSMKEPIADGVYDRISVDAYESVGRLYLTQVEWRDGRSVWAASIGYCLHVHRRAEIIEVVIEALGAVTG